MSRKAWRRWRREGRECPRGNELVFTRPTRPTSRQTKKQLTTIRTRRKDQHDHLRCLPTNTTNIKKNLEAARRLNNETLVNANFETADYDPEAAHIRYWFSKWRLNCCHIAVSQGKDLKTWIQCFGTSGSFYNSVADQRTALGGFQADRSMALSEMV